MDRAAVKRMIDAELASAGAFAGVHGISSVNIHNFLIEPTSVTVMVHGSQPAPREMWLVLQEDAEGGGYLVAFDPSSSMWGLVMRDAQGVFALVSGLTETFVDAVVGM